MGYGNMGSAIAEDLAKSLPESEIVIAGRRGKKAQEVASTLAKRNVSSVQLDAQSQAEVESELRKFDLAVGALPGNLGYKSAKAAITAGIDFVDISYMPENPLELHDAAKKADVTVVPDCGVAPGLSSLLVGHAVAKLDYVDSVQVMVGGLPEGPVPPLDYTTTWSTEGLIDEYTRTAKIVQGSKVVEVEPLSGLEEIQFPGIGGLEAFYTDGLRTLLHTIKNVDTMWEKTLRYPGHVKKIKLLQNLGFLDEQPVKINGNSVSPRQMTIKLMDNKLQRPEVKDLLALKVEVGGSSAGSKKSYVYHLLDRYDETHKVTAMARTTGFPASIVAQLLAKASIEEKGILPMEKIAEHDEIFTRILNELEKRHIHVKESISP
ncbi:MAG: saccharopine dehydrogenase family protein [Candidatus Bathyarchaeota archaeon]|nr:MAG: saccharopine dehydrogenase family protein [Candidatus Bathyarchaeota archaeon]